MVIQTRNTNYKIKTKSIIILVLIILGMEPNQLCATAIGFRFGTTATAYYARVVWDMSTV